MKDILGMCRERVGAADRPGREARNRRGIGAEMGVEMRDAPGPCIVRHEICLALQRPDFRRGLAREQCLIPFCRRPVRTLGQRFEDRHFRPER